MFNITSATNEKIYSQCEALVNENSIVNGGSLKFNHLYLSSDYILYATLNDKIVGFIYLANEFILENDLYLMQIVVKKNMQNLGIGSRMINHLKKHCKQFSCITSNVRPDNVASLNFHKKNGFKVVGENEYGLTLAKRINKLFNNKLSTEKVM